MKSVVSVEPNRGLTAQLRCEFHGFPEHVSWRKGGSEITPAFSEAYRFLRRRWTREEDGVIEAMLEIQAVQVEDYANYFCKGSNKFGEDQDIVHLTSKYRSILSAEYPGTNHKIGIFKYIIYHWFVLFLLNGDILTHSHY